MSLHNCDTLDLSPALPCPASSFLYHVQDKTFFCKTDEHLFPAILPIPISIAETSVTLNIYPQLITIKGY